MTGRRRSAARRPRSGAVADALRGARQATSRAAAPWRERLRPVTDFVSPLGLLTGATAAASLVIGGVWHWGEFVLAGYVLLAVVLLCVLLTVGRTDLQVTLSLQPVRVMTGGRAHGRIEVRNLRRGPVLPLALELPVGATAGRFTLPGLAAGAGHVETFSVPTTRRGVVPVGPVATVRGDPFGLLHRTMRWTPRIELFVHPRLVAVGSIDSGLLRDLEGRPTADLSVSDLAFHALREYVPGDDRRYIHWRSTAKAAAGVPGSRFLVRQFLDTRRSHLCVVVDADERSYDEADEFELAITAGASLAVRAIRDDVDTTVVVGAFATHEGTEPRTLDTFARAVAGRTPLPAATARAVRLAPATSVALLVTGRYPDFEQLRRAAANFGPDVAVVVLRVDPSRPVGTSALSGFALLSMAEPADLPRLFGTTA